MASTSAFRPGLGPPFTEMSVFRTRRSSDWSLTGVGPLSGLSLFDHATRLVAEHGETAPSPASPDPHPTRHPGHAVPSPTGDVLSQP